MFFIVAVTNGVLTAKLNVQKNKMLGRESKLRALYKLIRELASAKNTNELLTACVKQVQDAFGSESIIFFPEGKDKLNRNPYPASNFVHDEMEFLAAQACFVDKTESGRTTSIVGGAEGLYFPLLNDSGEIICTFGVKIDEELKAGSEELIFIKEYINELTPFLEKFADKTRLK